MSTYNRNNQNSGFIHSIKVPKIYKTCAKIVETVTQGGGGLKDVFYNTAKTNLKGTYALITKTIQYNSVLDKVLEKTKLLKENPRLNVWLAKTLITELLVGKGKLQGESKPVQTVNSYRDALEKAFTALDGEEKANSYSGVVKPRYVRVNTLRATTDEIIKELRNEGWIFVPFHHGDYQQFLEKISNLGEDEFMKDLHVKDLLVFAPGTEFHQHYLYQNATLILQDKASCLPALALKPDPLGTVLDMCAAPGMKTTLLSALMRNKGIIYAVEQNKRRFHDMEKMILAAGCENVTPVLRDSLSLGCNDYQSSEYILVDPTCSGSGMTDREKLFPQPQSDEKLRQLAAFQRKLLHHALTNFPVATRVVYSTCSILIEENEQVVDRVLSQLPPGQWSLEKALPDWPSRGSSEYEFGEKCITARLENDLTTGFFIALFVKTPKEYNEPTLVKTEHKKRKEEHEEAEEEAPETTKKRKKHMKNY